MRIQDGLLPACLSATSFISGENSRNIAVDAAVCVSLQIDSRSSAMQVIVSSGPRFLTSVLRSSHEEF